MPRVNRSHRTSQACPACPAILAAIAAVLFLAVPVPGSAQQAAGDPIDVRAELGVTGLVGASHVSWWSEAAHRNAVIQADLTLRAGRLGLGVQREWGKLYGQGYITCPDAGGVECATEPPSVSVNRYDWAARLEYTFPGVPVTGSATVSVGGGVGAGRTVGDLAYRSRFGLVGLRAPVVWAAAVQAELRSREDRIDEYFLATRHSGWELRFGVRWAPLRLEPVL